MSSSAPSRRPILAVFSHGFNIAAALAAVFAAGFLIPRFAGIFQDMLGPEPLPPLTAFVLRFQPLWLLLGFVYSLVALSMAWRYRLRSPPSSPSIILILLAAAQVGLTLIALFLPLGTIIQQRPPGP